ncbi:MAG: DMT family transporter [Thermomicrobiales bacterium]
METATSQHEPSSSSPEQRAGGESSLGAYISLAVAMSIVGSSVVTGKYITDAMPIFLASGIRFIIATGILAVWMTMQRRSGIVQPRISRRDHGVMALQAFTGIFIFNVLLLLGLKLTTATTSGIITSATPAIIALLSLFLGERLTGRIWMGVLLAMAGVLAVNLFGAGGVDSPASNPLLGALLVLGAVVGEALYTIFGKMLSGRIAPVAIATWVSLYGALMFLLPGLWELRGFDPGKVPASAWWSVAYSATAVTVVAFVLWFRGLQRVPASTAAPFTGMIPIVAVVLAAILLHEPVGWPHLVGIVCVISGILLITSGSSRRARMILEGTVPA